MKKHPDKKKFCFKDFTYWIGSDNNVVGGSEAR